MLSIVKSVAVKSTLSESCCVSFEFTEKKVGLYQLEHKVTDSFFLHLLIIDVMVGSALVGSIVAYDFFGKRLH